MNNPFAADRNIFSNINRQTVRPAQTQSNNFPPQNNNNNLNSNIGLNRTTSNQDNKLDLNFRAEFRDNSRPVVQKSLSSYESPNTNFTNTNSNIQNRVISDKSYSPYNSNFPKNTIVEQESSSQYGGSSIPSITIPSSSMLYSTNKISNSNNANGQKITFGASDLSEHKQLEYDRNKFVNRNDFINQKSNHSTSNHHNNNINEQSYTPPKNHKLSMSPIHGNKNVHDISSQSLNEDFKALDFNEEDLSKILANSKNQEELCKLLGIEKPTIQYMPISDTKEQGGFQHKYSSEYIREPPNFTKKTSLPESNYDDDKQEVFNYEAEDIPKYPNQYYSVPNTQITNASKVIKTKDNSQGNAQTQVPGVSSKNQLQAAIDAQMAKMSIKGKARIFMSASQKIQTVRYNMERI